MSRLESTLMLVFLIDYWPPFDRMSHDQIKSIRADVEEYCSVLCYALIVQPNLALSVLSDLP